MADVSEVSEALDTSQETVEDITVDEASIESVQDEAEIPKAYVVEDARLFASSYGAFRRSVASVKSSRPHTNYLICCKWAPDGSCLLTNSEDHCIRLFNFPTSYATRDSSICEDMGVALTVSESEQIYDCCWYPAMNSTDAATCLFATTSRFAPIHLWDAYTGKLRATYKAYNNVDEVVSANSVAFSLDGSKLYAGFDKTIRIFDTALPGRLYNEVSTYDKSQKGQRGILSCIAVNPTESLYAVGSYSKQISIYDTKLNSSVLCLEGHSGGVTHISFSPDGSKLVSGGRKDPDILVWDIRNLACVLASLPRQVSTNQKIYFDINAHGEYLFSGNDDGMVSMWDLKSGLLKDESVVPATMRFRAHDDCTNGISVHPTLPVLATTSGQRKFADISDDLNEDEIFSSAKLSWENSLKVWALESECLPNLSSQSTILDMESYESSA